MFVLVKLFVFSITAFARNTFQKPHTLYPRLPTLNTQPLLKTCDQDQFQRYQIRRTFNHPSLITWDTCTIKARSAASTNSLHQILMDSTSSATTTLDEFAFFPKLPFDLRTQIWRLSLPGPRLVNIIWDGSCKSTAKIPPALHVCRESRHELRRWYKLSFGNKNGKAIDKQGTVWFNKEIDTFCMDGSIVGNHDDEENNYSATCIDKIMRDTSDLATILHLAIEIRLLERYWFVILLARNFVFPNQFKGVKNAYLFSVQVCECSRHWCPAYECQYRDSPHVDGRIMPVPGFLPRDISERMSRAKRALYLDWKFATYVAPARRLLTGWTEMGFWLTWVRTAMVQGWEWEAYKFIRMPWMCHGCLLYNLLTQIEWWEEWWLRWLDWEGATTIV